MATSLTIPNTNFEQPALDYALLRHEGIKHIEKLAGKVWTDFNSHDPGITILEQLCYAITDLAYRVEYTIPDLLAEDNSHPYANFFSAAEILISEPVTLIDLRKLIIDVPGVKNAWIEKAEQVEPVIYFNQEKNEISHQADQHSRVVELLALKGLYRVYIEQSGYSDISSDTVLQAVTQRLHAHRNLCEDFASIEILRKQDIQIHAHIEIAVIEDAEQLLADLYQAIANYFSPDVQFHSLKKLLADGKQIDQIFDGPRLNQGFIDSDQLSNNQRKTEIPVSDLIHVIMDIDGVQAVRNIFLTTGLQGEITAKVDKHDWILTLDPNKNPFLDINYSNITLEKDRLAFGLDGKRVKALYESVFKQSKPALDTGELNPPPGRNRKVSHYYSFQHQFPDTYGVNSIGLPGNATPQRRSQTRQLKAYLLFFDQLLANHFSQLGHINELFSFDSAHSRTYFADMINDSELGLDFQQNYADASSAGFGAVRKGDGKSHREWLQRITEFSPESKDKQQRKSRFLNHLLARFAEQFTDYALLQYGLHDSDGEVSADKIMRDKQAFLQNYPQISATRGKAFNYLLAADSKNRSGLEQRIRYKLGINDPQENFYLLEHILLRPMVGDQQQQQPLLTEMDRKDPYSLRLSFVFPSWPKRFQNPQFNQLVERTLREETPAHLMIDLRWLDRAEMTVFETTHQDWLQQRRNYWLNPGD